MSQRQRFGIARIALQRRNAATQQKRKESHRNLGLLRP
jgi:hypothetical protein